MRPLRYNGSDMGLKDMVDIGTYLWTYWGPNGSVIEPLGTPTSFYRQKGLDKTLTQQTVHAGTVDWVEIRFAEVLMNFGEAANELDKMTEALDVLYQIKREQVFYLAMMVITVLWLPTKMPYAKHT